MTLQPSPPPPAGAARLATAVLEACSQQAYHNVLQELQTLKPPELQAVLLHGLFGVKVLRRMETWREELRSGPDSLAYLCVLKRLGLRADDLPTTDLLTTVGWFAERGGEEEANAAKKLLRV